ncbi:hypothetical protein BOS5A_210391 [Bosea sp. EC-HK365B]|nr:hypothetical protein BOSE7B_120254 [Bosea sp. 7B]CAD5278895.1 hypothetical protein BOSE21B_30662 [Bosea sp. 21B]VVT59600.1 hypothetical protein BOS5A_210391 [Bosea sp. EC-HK365B]VXB97386.1 hypothetical protein BOSE127_160285 [Bosea sp. 127]
MWSPRTASSASTWTASKSVLSTVSMKARTSSSSIPTSASTAASASRNARPRRSSRTPNRVSTAGCSSMRSLPRAGPTSRRRRTHRLTPRSSTACRTSSSFCRRSPAKATEVTLRQGRIEVNHGRPQRGSAAFAFRLPLIRREICGIHKPQSSFFRLPLRGYTNGALPETTAGPTGQNARRVAVFVSGGQQETTD